MVIKCSWLFYGFLAVHEFDVHKVWHHSPMTKWEGDKNYSEGEVVITYIPKLDRYFIGIDGARWGTASDACREWLVAQGYQIEAKLGASSPPYKTDYKVSVWPWGHPGVTEEYTQAQLTKEVLAICESL